MSDDREDRAERFEERLRAYAAAALQGLASTIEDDDFDVAWLARKAADLAEAMEAEMNRRLLARKHQEIEELPRWKK